MKFTGKYLDNVENPQKVKIYKSFTSETKTEQSGDKRILVAKISTPNADRSRDHVYSKGAKLDNFMKNPVVLFAHDYSSKPIAKCTNIKTSDDGIIATVEFLPEGVYSEADIIYTMYKEGFLNAWSIGFMPDDYEGNEQGGYDFKTWEMFEFSSVPVPDNPEALTIMRGKGINVDKVAEQLQEAGIEVDAPEEEKVEAVKEEPKETQVADDAKLADLTLAQLKSVLTPVAVKKDVDQVTSLAYVLSELDWLSDCFEYNEVSQSTLDKLNQAIQLLMDVIKEQATLGQKGFKINGKIEKAGRTISAKHEGMLSDAKDHMTKAMDSVQTVIDAAQSAANDTEDDQEKGMKTDYVASASFAKKDTHESDLLDILTWKGGDN